MKESPFNRRFGVEVEDLEDGSVRLGLRLDASLENEVGTVHGGVALFLLDGAMGRACARAVGAGRSCVTVQLSTQFMAKAPNDGHLVATGRVSRIGRSIAFLEGECRGEDGTLVARAQGTWALR